MRETKERYYKTLQELARVINSNLPFKDLLDQAVRIVGKASDCACSIMLLDENKEHLFHSATYGLSDWYVKKGPVDADKSIPQTLLGNIVTLFDVTREPGLQFSELAEKEGIASILSAPLTERGAIVGVIRLYSRHKRQFPRLDKAFVQTVADIVSLTLENAGLWNTLRKDYESTKKDLAEAKIEIARLSSTLKHPSIFAHPSEEDFARLLDFYRINWQYEPRSFPLQWDGSKVAEMFTPDFYLPDFDLYLELTTMNPRLATEKNRKIRGLKELHPDINIKLIDKKGYYRLIAKYFYHPVAVSKIKGVDTILFNHTQIQRRVRQLARQITKDYAGHHLLLVGVLKGVFCFMADLMRHISLPVTIDFLAVSYFSGEKESPVRITKDLDYNLSGMDVLMVEDIVDTGMTLNFILQYLSTRKPASIKVCTLLDKRVRRLINVPLDYIGFEIQDEFVIGYGLDYQGEYRNLPFIGVLNPSLLGEEESKEKDLGNLAP